MQFLDTTKGSKNYKGSILSDDMMIIEGQVDIFIGNNKIATTTTGLFSINVPTPATELRFVVFGYKDKITTGAEIEKLGTVYMKELVVIVRPNKSNNTLLYLGIAALVAGGIYYTSRKSPQIVKL